MDGMCSTGRIGTGEQKIGRTVTTKPEQSILSMGMAEQIAPEFYVHANRLGI